MINSIGILCSFDVLMALVSVPVPDYLKVDKFDLGILFDCFLNCRANCCCIS